MNQTVNKQSNMSIKRLICMLLIAASLFVPLTGVSNLGIDFGLVTTAEAGYYQYTYYPQCDSRYGSLVDALNSIGVNSSYSNRKSIAALNGYSNYSGTASQNTALLNLLKQGRLVKSKTWVNESVTYYPKCNSRYSSLVDALNSIGVNSSYSNRKSIAALNGYSNYSGTASQNTALLNLLKQGKLIKSKGKTPTPTPTRKPTPTPTRKPTPTPTRKPTPTPTRKPTPTPKARIITNSSYNVYISPKSKENRPHYENAVGSRSKDAYNTVINQFKVTSNNRYKRDSYTYCNIFAWDVMSAMRVSLPHWIKNNIPATSTTKGATELNVNATYNWINTYGYKYGWYTVTAKRAQERANSGYPTIVIWKNPSGGSGHIAVVRPAGNGYSYSNTKGPVIAQAGASNYNYCNMTTGFGTDKSVQYWTHA